MKRLVMSAVCVTIFLAAAAVLMARGGQGARGSSELDTLKARVARLEAKEEVLSTFNQYLYSMDTGFGDDLIATFCSDAVLDVPNFPGANDNDLHFEGRDKIASLYKPYNHEPRIGGGHHTANMAVNVHPDLAHADVSAYFMTSGQGGVQGGRYEGVMRSQGAGKWCWQTFTITSAWGFRTKDFITVSKPVSATKYSPRGGHHAVYKPR